MEKLFSCMFGSRLYGTQTPTSDVDWKHIVLPNINDLLLCKKIENKVKKTNTEKNTRNGADDVDEEFIPLQVFARHFVEGQTYAIELAFAVDGNHANQSFNEDYQEMIIEFIHELRENFLTSNIKAMMGYVVNQASLYSFKGERLNVTREVKEVFASAAKSFVGVKVGDVFKEDKWFASKMTELTQKYPKYFKLDQYDIGGGVLRPCFVLLEKTIPFTDRIEHSLGVINSLESKYGARADAASTSNVDWKATMHALRIVNEGLDLLENHKLTFPFNQAYVDFLLSVRRGEYPIEQVRDQLSTKLDHLKDLEKTTTLPCSDEQFQRRFEEWLVGWLAKFYNLA